MSLPYDPRRPEGLADPYPVLHHLQDEDPVHWSEILGGWVLTRYDDVKAALGDPRLSSDRITPFVNHYAKGGGGELGALGRLVGLWAVFTDPPTHTRLRGLRTGRSPAAQWNSCGHGSRTSSPSCSKPSSPTAGWTSSATSRIRCPSPSSPR